MVVLARELYKLFAEFGTLFLSYQQDLGHIGIFSFKINRILKAYRIWVDDINFINTINYFQNYHDIY